METLNSHTEKIKLIFKQWLRDLIYIFVAIVFLIFGLYGLSADNKFRNLPFLKPVIFIIAGIYILRGLGELFSDFLTETNTLNETFFSLTALTIGLLFLI